MIKDKDIIKAEEGKLLWFIPEQIILGKAARLVEYKGHQLIEEDFEEVDEYKFELINGVYYDFKNKSYAYIKTFIIKLHYSNDDQLAIILNDDEVAYNKMQSWREYATKIAKKYTD